MLCIYCGIEKPIEEFTKEHVIPKAIGGKMSRFDKLPSYDP
ncbi:MAG: hypothetical protein HY097_03015 [Nitrospinae bacterium]|nr:hypothetical protein [Nitrospinota bacterium]